MGDRHSPAQLRIPRDAYSPIPSASSDASVAQLVDG